MHIQEGTNTTLTTCTKMTEEVDRRHGVNGTSSSKGHEETPGHGSADSATGGRLKFFKDGKFILELVRGCARDGERAGWVSVPRKTFWPPAAAAPAHTHTAHLPRAERAASLSVSDDNSSIQSSPWQRDHCWKQTTPRRNISKELTMFYCRPSTLVNATIDAGSRRKRRRPYDVSPPAVLNGAKKSLTNGVCDKKLNGDVTPPDSKGQDCIDGPFTDKAKDDDRRTDSDREKYYHMKLKKPYQYLKLRVYKKTKPSIKQKTLGVTIDRLRERMASLPAPVNAKLAHCRQEHAMVSPRKRILRELERVTLEDQGTKRRAKTVPALSTASYPPSPGPSQPRPERHATQNGTAPRRDPPISKNVSSYSIHSLLSMPDDSPTRRSPEAKRSPHHSYPPSLKTESPSSVTSPDLSPSPDNYRYRYLMGSPGQHPAPRDSPTPPFRPYSASTSPYGGGSGRSSRLSPAGYSPQYRGSPARDEWRELPYVYGYGYLPPPPHYRAPPAPLYYYTVPPGPWAPLQHPLLTDHIPKEEPTSDLPLNLSKH